MIFLKNVSLVFIVFNLYVTKMYPMENIMTEEIIKEEQFKNNTIKQVNVNKELPFVVDKNFELLKKEFLSIINKENAYALYGLKHSSDCLCKNESKEKTITDHKIELGLIENNKKKGEKIELFLAGSNGYRSKNKDNIPYSSTISLDVQKINNNDIELKIASVDTKLSEQKQGFASKLIKGSMDNFFSVAEELKFKNPSVILDLDDENLEKFYSNNFGFSIIGNYSPPKMIANRESFNKAIQAKKKL